MAVALENLKTLNAPAKVAILGDMLELGEYTDTEHQRIATLAIEAGVTQLILVGPLFSKIQLHPPHLNFNNVEDMQSWWSGQHWENTTVLIKGSRGMHLESLLRNSVH
jgi:UDP-N-acetylmuramoyl-tripeptide--D-alanyl-D-alanine ligase